MRKSVLASYALAIRGSLLPEKREREPMDIEWAKTAGRENYLLSGSARDCSIPESARTCLNFHLDQRGPGTVMAGV